MLEIDLDAEVSYTLKNPAQSFVEDGAPDFGFTEPFYNGKSAISEKQRGISVPMDFDATVVTLTEDNGFTAKITKCAEHYFSWVISLPEWPNLGYWHHFTNNGPQILKVLKECMSKRSEIFSPLARGWFTNPENQNILNQHTSQWQVRIIPLPGVQQFMSHILAHECQHVEDHAWLAKEIVGPLNSWHQDNINTKFTSPKKDDLHGVRLANTAVGNQRIFSYWQRAIIESGHLYHRTPEGGHPTINIMNIAKGHKVTDRGLIEITVTPTLLLHCDGSVPPVPTPHCYKRGQVFTVYQTEFNGNEPALTYINKNDYRARTIKFVIKPSPEGFESDIASLYGNDDDEY